MKRVLPLLGLLMLVSLLVNLNGCIIETTEITFVVTDIVCTGFEENHNSEDYTDPSETFDDDFFSELDAILADNDMTKDDIEDVSVVAAYYQVTDGPTAPPAPATSWTVSGRVWIQVNGGPLVLIAEYQSVVLSAPMAPMDPVAIDTDDAGLAALDAALADYLDDTTPNPTITFWTDRETGDISPSPTVGDPFLMDWNGCLSMRVDFVEEFDVYDMFPGE